MTPTRTQHHAINADLQHRTVADAMEAAGPQVWDDMTVEVALSVMAAARSGHLVVCDEDGQCTGMVTHARLTAVCDGLGYTGRVPLRDIVGDNESFATPLTTIADAERTMRHRRIGALPVVDEHGNALGVLALSH
ncbi:CBS domain-containing protein [Streptomyces sp. NPDC092370]|uniref:CBS domain-containing protein n=1 Tax=Streptomyces sp. NPDC092370 TaxID=3366016 RepID=UPI00381746BB